MIRLRSMLFVVALVVPMVGFAKRGAPPKVEPVLTDTLKIVAPLDDGRTARIQVFDRADGRLLWSVVLFENKIDPRLEADAQWRFVKSMRIVAGALEVVAEGGARYRVNLTTRKVETRSITSQRSNQAPKPMGSAGSPQSVNSDARLAPTHAVASAFAKATADRHL